MNGFKRNLLVMLAFIMLACLLAALACLNEGWLLGFGLVGVVGAYAAHGWKFITGRRK